MKTVYVLPLLLLSLASPASAQISAAPAPNTSNITPTTPACDAEKQDADATCNINTTSPECVGAKKTYTLCIVKVDSANGKGPCAAHYKLMLQYCTSDPASIQCRNARVPYNNCIDSPPGY